MQKRSLSLDAAAIPRSSGGSLLAGGSQAPQQGAPAGLCPLEAVVDIEASYAGTAEQVEALLGSLPGGAAANRGLSREEVLARFPGGAATHTFFVHEQQLYRCAAAPTSPAAPTAAPTEASGGTRARCHARSAPTAHTLHPCPAPCRLRPFLGDGQRPLWLRRAMIRDSVRAAPAAGPCQCGC